MNLHRLSPLVLAGLLQVIPFLGRAVDKLPLLPSSAVTSVLRWVVGTAALIGTYHAVSAASAVLVSASTITGTTGTRLSYQIKINDGQNRLAESWVIAGQKYGRTGSATSALPPGLALALWTGIINGIPISPGTFAVPMTAYEKPNLGGGRLSFTLTFTITGNASPPTITSQPVGGTAIEGSDFTLQVVASGTGTLSYQWQHGGVPLPSATGSSLTLSPVTLGDAGDYLVIVSNSGGNVTSSTATLSVSPAAGPPTITAQPSSSTLHVGEAFAVTVGATGTGDLHYQWLHNGASLPDSNVATLAVSGATESDSGEYQVTVSDANGSAVSAPTTVTVVPLRALLSMNSSHDQATVVAQSIPGRDYTIEAAESLGAEWINISDVRADGNTIRYMETPVAGTLRFWRIRVAPLPSANN